MRWRLVQLSKQTPTKSDLQIGWTIIGWLTQALWLTYSVYKKKLEAKHPVNNARAIHKVPNKQLTVKSSTRKVRDVLSFCSSTAVGHDCQRCQETLSFLPEPVVLRYIIYQNRLIKFSKKRSTATSLSYPGIECGESLSFSLSLVFCAFTISQCSGHHLPISRYNHSLKSDSLKSECERSPHCHPVVAA